MIKIKGSIGIGFAGEKRTFELTLEDIGLTLESWKELTQEERDKILEFNLQEEIDNVLDAGIWVEGDED